MKKPVSKFVFQVHNLQRYTTGGKAGAFKNRAEEDSYDDDGVGLFHVRGTSVGLCTLNQVDPSPITYSLSNP